MKRKENKTKVITNCFIDWEISVISLFLALAFACSTLPPAQPAQNLKSIVGVWEGVMVGRTTSRITLTIREDGTWENIDDSGRRFTGTARLSDGKFRYKSETTGKTGIYILHEGQGKRVLVFRTDDGTVRGELTPAKK